MSDLDGVVDPQLLVGFDTGDDAAVRRITSELAVVQTLDFFMPIVDDPFVFGQIAAANALSDIYAMGADPVMALAILGYPTKHISPQVARQIMLGGTEVCNRAGIRIAGGHSIDDTEPKFGLSVTGVVHPDKMLRNSTAQPGDVLMLTKPLGVGVLGQANKKSLISPEQYQAFILVTTQLNATAAQIAKSFTVNACTDVTGFGLLGHGLEMAQGSGLTLTIWPDQLPILDGVLELIERGIRPGATRRNIEHCSSHITWQEGTNAWSQLLADPQTSGGLLFAVPSQDAHSFRAALLAGGLSDITVIGEFSHRGETALEISRLNQ